MSNHIDHPAVSQDDAENLKNVLGKVAAKPFYIWANEDCANKTDDFKEAKVIRLALINAGGVSVHIVDADGVEVVDAEIEAHEKAVNAGHVAGEHQPELKPKEPKQSLSPERLFADDSGRLFQIVEETVEFAPQGGGPIQKIPRAEFERRFKPANLPAFSLVEIGAEWLPDDMKVPAYSNGRRWNGWAMPSFTLEAGQSLLKYMPDLSYDSARDAFISKDADDAQSEEEVFAAETLIIDGSPVKTYAIGAGSWCWYLAE